MRSSLAVVALCATLAGCQTVVDGAAQPADHLGVLTSTPNATPRVLALQDKLLSQAEIAGVVGETRMAEDQTFTEPSDDWSTVNPTDCTSHALPAQKFDYSAYEYVQLAGHAFRGDGNHTVVEVVSTFRDAKKAAGLRSYETSLWRSCKQPFTVTVDDDVTQWTPGPVTAGEARSSTSRQQDGTQRVCQHTIAAKGTHVVETNVCGEDGQSARQADEITDRILAKLPE